jgi:gluconolactonase
MTTISRRVLIGRIGAVVGAAALTPRVADAQGAQAVLPPPPFDTHRDYSPSAEPVSYPDPDIITADPVFNALRVNNTAIHRLWTGGMWSEGPAWCSQGKYLVWSDVPMGVQRRWIDDDGRVTVFRNPSNNSNGNTFDFNGRQVTCEHTGRRIARYEHDGSITAIAEWASGSTRRTMWRRKWQVRPATTADTTPARDNQSAWATRNAIWRWPTSTASTARAAASR